MACLPAVPSLQNCAPTLAARARHITLAQQLVILLACHFILWSWVGWSSRSNFDSPGDMVEAYAWAQGWQWGYFKHPPLSAWVVGLWFSVVPESHLGYSMLAAFNSALGLAGLALLAREFLPSRWVLLAVATASLAPGATTLAMRFNANAILISTWPWAMALFVRLMAHGRTRDALGCGLACALALLGKYYSGVMVLSLLATALWLPAWRARLLSGPGALAALVCVAVMTPHLLWLMAQTDGPLQYARAAAGQGHAGSALSRALTFALAQCVFPLLALLALRLALQGPARHRAFWQSLTAPLRPSADAPWLLAMLPIGLTMTATVLTGARTASVWGLALAGGLALLATGRARAAGAALCLRRLWRTLGLVWLVVALLSPLWWTARAWLSAPSVAEPREELALAVGQAWQAQFGDRLRWVSGGRVLAASVAFYSPAHPRYWSMWNNAVETPWADGSAIGQDGGAFVCELDDEPCQRMAELWSVDRHVISVAKQSRGFQFGARQYAMYWMPPTAPAMPVAVLDAPVR